MRYFSVDWRVMTVLGIAVVVFLGDFLALGLNSFTDNRRHIFIHGVVNYALERFVPQVGSTQTEVENAYGPGKPLLGTDADITKNQEGSDLTYYLTGDKYLSIHYSRDNKVVTAQLYYLTDLGYVELGPDSYSNDEYFAATTLLKYRFFLFFLQYRTLVILLFIALLYWTVKRPTIQKLLRRWEGSEPKVPSWVRINPEEQATPGKPDRMGDDL